VLEYLTNKAQLLVAHNNAHRSKHDIMLLEVSVLIVLILLLQNYSYNLFKKSYHMRFSIHNPLAHAINLNMVIA